MVIIAGLGILTREPCYREIIMWKSCITFENLTPLLQTPFEHGVYPSFLGYSLEHSLLFII